MPSDRQVAVLTVIGLVAVFLGTYVIAQERLGQQEIGEYGTAHEHLHFKAVIGNETVDFSQEQYLGQARRVHFHEGNGILHVHAENVDIGFTLRTLDLQIDEGCLTISNTSYCGNATHEFRFYANGEQVDAYQDYVLGQGDNLLLWYGPQDGQPDMSFFEKELPRDLQKQQPGRPI